MRLWAFIALLALGSVAVASPGEAVAAAAADVRTLPVGIQPYVRYLDLSGCREKERGDLKHALASHVNGASRGLDIVPPVVVTPTLLRINLKDYVWDVKLWEKLLDVPEPWFHFPVEVVEDVFKDVELGYWVDGRGNQYNETGAGRTWQTVRVEKRKVGTRKVRRANASIDAPGIAELITLTQSQIPIVRGDWFFVQTSIQKDRAVGYYDLLALGKKEADFEKLVGADKDKARERRRFAAIMARSGVTLENRGILREEAFGGNRWVTQDFKTSVARQNVIRLLEGDRDPPQGDASEQYGTLPNGLYAFWLQNDKGERQDAAPDFIASDSAASGTDRRVHIGLSCVRCHVEGIRPVDDWARKVYRGAITLQSVDYNRFLELRNLYLSDLAGRVKDDQAAYAKAIFACNGLTLADNAKAWARAWDHYQERDLLPADVAFEFGVPEERLLKALKAYALAEQARVGFYDPIIAGWIQTPAVSARREHVEEIAPLITTILKGY